MFFKNISYPQKSLQAFWISGFVDGDRCFFMSGKEKKSSNNPPFYSSLQEKDCVSKQVAQSCDVGRRRHRFIVSQDKSSIEVLYSLKSHFQCGTVQKQGRNMMCYQVGDRKSLIEIIIPFFLKFPLQTSKRDDFYRWSYSLLMNLSRRQKSSMTTTQRSHEFLLYKSLLEKKESSFSFSINRDWFAGFLDADGSFVISIVQSYPRPQMLLGSKAEDKALLESLQRWLGAGVVRIRNEGVVIFQVSRCKEFVEKVFPCLFTDLPEREKNRFKDLRKDPFVEHDLSLFERDREIIEKIFAVNDLKTRKAISLTLFRYVVEMILKKQHKTQSGIEKILKIKEKLNKKSGFREPESIRKI